MFPKTLYAFYWQCIKKHPWYFSIMILLGTTLTAMERVLPPFVSKWEVNIFEYAITNNTSKIIHLMILIFLLMTTTRIIAWLESWCSSHYRPLINRYTDMALLCRIYQNDCGYFVDTMAGEISPKLSNIVHGLNDMICNPLNRFAGLITSFIIVIGMLLKINIWFMIIILSTSIIRSVWRFMWQKRTNKLRKEHVAASAKISGIKTDGLNNALTVQLFANENTETQWLSKQFDESIKIEKNIHFINRIRFVPTSFAYMFASLGTLILAIFLIQNKQISLADAIFSTTAFMTINGIFFNLSDLFLKFSEQRATIEKSWSDIITPISVVDKQNAHILKSKQMAIEFDNVTFAYKDTKILDKLCINIRPNERLGIVGLSGAGKSTIVNLLLRMYDVQSGAIKINGHDLRDITKKSLRKNIAIVPQDTSLFNRTIFDNIAYAKPNTKMSDVIRAAKQAQIHDFITSLPAGYNTIIGNRGLKLSGGQRSRIAIARAILKNAPILVMDEATAALDSASESAIQTAMKNVMKNKTVIVIAHRLSTLKSMDRIIVINKGHIIQSGTHKQLIQKNGIYKKLYTIQKQ